MAKTVRPNQVVSVRHPETGGMVVPNPTEIYEADDPLVREYPWLFSTDTELAQDIVDAGIESVSIESATRAPGERRTTRRQR